MFSIESIQLRLKKIFFAVSIIVSSMCTVPHSVSAQLQYIDTSSPNYTQNINNVVDADNLTDGQPLRDGAYLPVQSPDQTQSIGIIEQGEIQTYGQGQDATLLFVRSLVNYFLGFLGIIALILFMYSGFRIVIAGADDEAYTQAIKTFKKVGIVL